MERYIKRIIDIQGKLKSKSLFLFGPRQTGTFVTRLRQEESMMVL